MNKQDIGLIFGSSLLLMSCGTTAYQKGSSEYIEHQVYECRKLCANSEVNIAKIDGLDCVCNKPQQPFIYNPIVTSQRSLEPDQNRSPTSSNRELPVIINTGGGQVPPIPLEPKPNATTIQDATGHTIISQPKY